MFFQSHIDYEKKILLIDYNQENICAFQLVLSMKDISLNS